jgi:hypothetical protein
MTENSTEHFINKGVVYLVEKDKYETREDNINRGWCIAKESPSNNDDYTLKESESYINLYKSKYNCKYQQVDN